MWNYVYTPKNVLLLRVAIIHICSPNTLPSKLLNSIQRTFSHGLHGFHFSKGFIFICKKRPQLQNYMSVNTRMQFRIAIVKTVNTFAGATLLSQDLQTWVVQLVGSSSNTLLVGVHGVFFLCRFFFYNEMQITVLIIKKVIPKDKVRFETTF